MKTLSAKDINELHKEKFGVYPVITGINFFDSENTTEKILEAIEAGEPYVEEAVPSRVDI